MQNIEVTIPYSSRGNGQWHCSPDILIFLNTHSYGIADRSVQPPGGTGLREVGEGRIGRSRHPAIGLRALENMADVGLRALKIR